MAANPKVTCRECNRVRCEFHWLGKKHGKKDGCQIGVKPNQLGVGGREIIQIS